MAKVPLIQNAITGFAMKSSTPTASVPVGSFRVWNNWSSGWVKGDGYNINSNFNTTTGTFTAPITGKYLVTMTITSFATDRRRIGHVRFSDNTYREFVESTSQYADTGNSIVIHMNVGEWIQFGDHSTITVDDSLIASIAFLGA